MVKCLVLEAKKETKVSSVKSHTSVTFPQSKCLMSSIQAEKNVPLQNKISTKPQDGEEFKTERFQNVFAIMDSLKKRM